MLRQTFLIVFCLSVFVADCSDGLRAQNSPFDFAQRSDVGREIAIQPGQLQMIRELRQSCDAQCQARLMEMLTSASTDLQTQFLALDAETQSLAVQNLDQGIRENIETEMLDDIVLSSPQFARFEQLRTQFMGLDSLLTDRVSGLMGLSENQSTQIQELQNFGGELVNACRQDTSLSPEQQKAQIQNIQNVIIDQSINILNDSQIQIFTGLCGDRCQFDEKPTDEEPPTESDQTNESLVETNLEQAHPEAQPANPIDAAPTSPDTSTTTVGPQSGVPGGTVQPSQSSGGSTTRSTPSPQSTLPSQSGSPSKR